ncbi:MAG: DUF4185 domain-containing protein [Myxococcaceae bacterium]
MWHCLIILTIFCAACSKKTTQDSSPNFEQSLSCLPNFNDSKGWLGGDVAYSVLLDPKTSLWFFGDTFIGTADMDSRKNAIFIANSTAISQCNSSSGHSSIYFDWGGKKSTLPKAIFNSQNPNSRYWPMDGFTHNKQLYWVLVEVENTGKGPLDFEFRGVKLAKVSNFEESTDNWKIDFLDLNSEQDFLVGISIIKQDKHVIFVTLIDQPKNTNKNRPVILTRIPLDRLTHPKENLEYLATDFTWKPGISRTDAKTLFNNGMTEMSIRYHDSLKKWIAVMHHTKFPSEKIVISSASEIHGPWSSWETAYTTPEMLPETPGYDSETFCYAGKEQTQFSDDKNLTITYACNSFNPDKQRSNLNIYRPKIVQIPLENLKIN